MFRLHLNAYSGELGIQKDIGWEVCSVELQIH